MTKNGLKIIFLLTILALFTTNCTYNSLLKQNKILKKENKNLRIKLKENKTFINGLYSKIENETSSTHSQDNIEHSIDELKQQNAKLKQKVNEYKKFIDELYNKIEQ